MKIKHCSVTTLTPKEKKKIIEKLCYKDGLFFPIVKNREPKVRLGLIFERKTLVGWTALLLKGKEMMAYVDPKHRRKGFAKKASREVLDHNGFENRNVQVWTERMRRVVKKAGHKKVTR